MHPINKKNFGAKAGKLAVKFYDGSSVKTGWVLAQVATNRYKITDGTTTKVCRLAQNTDELTALNAGTGPSASLRASLCTIEITPFGGSLENVRRLMTYRAQTIQGSNVSWKMGVAATVAGQGTMTLRANAAPVVANALANSTATVAAAWTYVVPANTFSDANGDVLTYTATVSPSAALPAGYSFNATTRTFTKTAGAGTTGTLVLRVTASDGVATAFSEFNLVVS